MLRARAAGQDHACAPQTQLPQSANRKSAAGDPFAAHLALWLHCARCAPPLLHVVSALPRPTCRPFLLHENVQDCVFKERRFNDASTPHSPKKGGLAKPSGLWPQLRDEANNKDGGRDRKRSEESLATLAELPAVLCNSRGVVAAQVPRVVQAAIWLQTQAQTRRCMLPMDLCRMPCDGAA